MSILEALKNARQVADRFFLQLAAGEATHSPDPSTKNGAVFVCAPSDNVGEAPCYCKDCNRFSTIPNSLQKEQPDLTAGILTNRDLKLAWIEHAERNTLFTAHRRGMHTAGGTLYCPFSACTDCARAIVLFGVERVVRLPADAFDGYPERWRSSIRIADEIMLTAGVTVDEYDGPALDMTYFLDGKNWSV